MITHARRHLDGYAHELADDDPTAVVTPPRWGYDAPPMIRFEKVTPRLPVNDVTRTIGFYTETLGFRLELVWPDNQPTFAIVERDGLAVQFYVPEHHPDMMPGPPIGDSIVNFDVTDVRALHEVLKGRVPIEWGPEVYWYGRREFAVRDPNGYLIIFTEETNDPPTCVE